jgi:methionine biosynthesis protein MetW
MSLSLQTVKNTVPLLREMLRVGKSAIVSFPNFGYRAHRIALNEGRTPVSKHLPYQWFDSPNVRFFTMADFEALCADLGIPILERMAFSGGQRIDFEPNLYGEVGLYRIGRAGK